MDFMEHHKVKRVMHELVTPFINNGIPVAHFSQTGAHRFTELTYRTIKNLVLPRVDFLGPIAFFNRKVEKNYELGSEVYSLLLHVINTVNPLVFDVYFEAFHAGRFYECFLILQRLYSVDAEIERHIMTSVLLRNRKIRREHINAICFVDVCTKDVFCIDIPNLYRHKKCALHLPRQVLKLRTRAVLLRPRRGHHVRSRVLLPSRPQADLHGACQEILQAVPQAAS